MKYMAGPISWEGSQLEVERSDSSLQDEDSCGDPESCRSVLKNSYQAQDALGEQGQENCGVGDYSEITVQNQYELCNTSEMSSENFNVNDGNSDRKRDRC